MNKADLEKIFEENKEQYIKEWKEFLSFPSISTEPENNNDCIACAEWLSAHLKNIGFESKLLETLSKPVVYAERKGAPDQPTILFYGHYDVQPVDPIEKWISPPFEPEIRDGRMYARGAVDNKGQVFLTLKAIETLIKNNSLNSTIKILIEGEEEYGSEGISQSLPDWKDFIQADILMVADTSTVSSGAPTIIMGLRGIIHLEATLSGASHDLHSGVHGGVAPNPAQGIAELIASLHNSDGSIAVEGFCDEIKDPTEEELEAANVAFHAGRYTAKTNLEPVAGDKNFTPAERTSFRPSIDINGIQSGYNGPGMKTIIPTHATVKITSRLVPGQDPDACLNAIIKHLKKHAPDGLKLGISETEGGGPGFRLNMNSPLATKARQVLDQLTDMETAFLWEGASIPVVSELSKISTAEPLLVGFGSDDDKAHAPNESFAIERFRLGYLYTGLFLS